MLSLPLCLALCGCGMLLERSYSSVEPYANRYWDSGAEDTLRSETYQDLVNSLLLLVEERAEEGTIRCYDEANSYIQAQRARSEVRRETTLGSYLLSGLTFTYDAGTAYSTVTYQMTYREGTEDLDGLMSISDSQSLLDLLRLAVREEHEKLTARFSYDTPTADVNAAVKALWRELCLGEEAVQTAADGDAGEPPPDGEPEAELTPETGTEPVSPEPLPEAGGETEPVGLFPEEPECPPCPWTIRFYPAGDTAEIVEILLHEQWPKAPPVPGPEG